MRPPFLRRSGAPLAFAAVLALGGPSAAQSFDVLVSLVADDTLSGEPARDDDVIAHPPGGSAYVLWPRETLSLLAGPGSGGKQIELGDIDALHDRGGPLASDGLLFSLVSDQSGVLDGDIVGFGASGLEVFLAESAFVAAAGATDGNVDVDAFHLDPDGTILFSFAENEASSFLSGDQAGIVGDGDVLLWPAGSPSAQVLYTESQIDAFVAAALGGSASTGDTKGVARDPTTGEVLFVVQAPSDHDGSVFSTAGGGVLLAGHAEADFQFAGDVEFDALTLPAARWPALTISTCCPQPGEQLQATLRNAEPGAIQVFLLSLAAGPPLLATDGWGGLVTADDLLFAKSLATLHAVAADPLGEAQYVLVVPDGLLPLDVVLQVVSLGAPHEAGNPVVIEVAQ